MPTLRNVRPSASPTTQRPVYVTIGDVPRPRVSTAAVTYTPDSTILRVHPGIDVPTAAHDINNLLNDDDFLTWIVHYLGTNPGLLARFRESPQLNIPTPILRIPILAAYIPHPLRAPGVFYA